MRRNIVHVGAGTLSYEIREIVGVGHEIQALGQNITWENIGDPTQKGERVPDWMREIIRDLVDDERSWGYCDTAGVSTTREFLAAHVNARGGVQVTTDDILFFNGLGDAVARVYGYLRREARILGPSPAYSTHSSAEAAHSGYSHLTYELETRSGTTMRLQAFSCCHRTIRPGPSIHGPSSKRSRKSLASTICS
jgi:aspartate/methionine/tyrosine aminotransferase